MVCMMGFLHIEMASQECGGSLLAGSGWERMFTQAKIFTPGVSASLLGGKHVKRTRYAYQLTLAWLHMLKLQAYAEYCQLIWGPHETMEMWEKRLVSNAPTFGYWKTVQDYLLINSSFVRGQRAGDWPLTLNACYNLCPWFFAFGHTNYARWMPVFLKDMACLPEAHPDVHKAFMDGKFVVQRGNKKFSLMSLDQSQEHSIKLLKDTAGAKGLYGQQDEKEVIELSKPEVLRVIEEFENASLQSTNKSANTHHPESSSAEQKKFVEDLKALSNLINEGNIINPFKETGSDLMTLDTGEVMDPEVANCLRDAQNIGQTMFREFVSERIEKATKPLSDVIPRVRLYTFSNRPPADLKKSITKLGSAKSNTVLITKLFLSLKARPDADIDEFFHHENQREPPALSFQGKLMSGTKSTLLNCLPAMPNPGCRDASLESTVVLFDMAAIIHMVKPQRASLFGEYTQMQLLPFLESQLTECCTRVDAVWDTYHISSLKSQTRINRGETAGRRTKVSPKIPLPKGSEWQRFLNDSANKDALFKFLSDELHRKTSEARYLLLTTKAESVLSNRHTDITNLAPCQHEEADTRLMLHLYHAAQNGQRKAYIRTVDTDVIVLAMAHFNQLDLTELWVGLGTGKHFREIPIHVMCEQLGPRRCQSLLLFHAFTGCDVTSFMFGIGKKTAWNAWLSYPRLTDTFIALLEDPETLDLYPGHMEHLERFTVLMYSKNCNSGSVNEARKLLFTQSLKSLDSIPPTKHALFQHARRALLIAAFIWKQSLVKSPVIPDPSKWGWEWNERSKIWMPYWTDLPDASHGCSVLLHCGCSVACKGNWKCHRAGIRCSSLCKCQGGCTNNDMDIWLWRLLELSKSYQPYKSFMLCYCCLQNIVISLSWCKWSFLYQMQVARITNFKDGKNWIDRIISLFLNAVMSPFVKWSYEEGFIL